MIERIKNYIKQKNLIHELSLKGNFEVSFLAQGEYNQNFLISDGQKKYVFRLNYGSQLQLDNQIRYEYDALRWLAVSKKTPQVYYLDDTYEFFDQGLLIMEFLAGRPLNYRKDLLKAAGIFSAIHRFPLDEAAKKQFIPEKNTILSARVAECQNLLTPVFNSPVIALSAKKKLEQALKKCEDNVDQQRFFGEIDLWSVNNTEVNSHNFIIGEKSWLIDWEKPVISHPVQDISQFLASTTTLWRSNVRLTKSEKEQFLAAYLKQTGFEQGEFLTALKIYHPYLMLRALSWSAMAYDSYQTGGKSLKNPEIFQKVQSYLAADFLSNALKEQVFE